MRSGSPSRGPLEANKGRTNGLTRLRAVGLLARMGPPKIPLDELKALALIGLLEMAQEADHRPYPRTYTLRFVLAWLHSVSDGNRVPADRFWRTAVGEMSEYGADHSRSYMRGTTLRATVEALSKGVGVDFHKAVSGKYVSRCTKARDEEWEAGRIAALAAEPGNPNLEMIVAGIREKQAEREARRAMRREQWGWQIPPDS